MARAAAQASPPSPLQAGLDELRRGRPGEALRAWEESYLSERCGLRARELLRAALYQVQAGAAEPSPPPALPEAPEALRAAVTKLVMQNDLPGAMRLLEARLAQAPADPEAQRLLQRCHEFLTRRYVARLGALTRQPRLAAPLRAEDALALGPGAASVLGQIDGRRSFAEAARASGLPRLEALRLLAGLLERGAIA